MKKKKQLQSNLEADMLSYAQEATLTKKVKNWLDTQDDIAYYKASDRYQKGVSDIIMNVGGVFVLAELKAKNGIERPHQKLFIKEMTRPGGVGGFCYTLHDVKELVHAARLRKNNC
jgi:hypothetical protein